jgi:hypothetical protein
MTKQCGTCTKCCEGYIPGSINGIKIFAGNPCSYIKDSCCSIYLNKPNNCTVYKCEWLTNNDIPEFMKPTSIGFILDSQETSFRIIENIRKKFKYLRVTQCEPRFNNSSFENILEYVTINKFNAVWKKDNQLNWAGSEEFCNALNYTFKVKELNLELW